MLSGVTDTHPLVWFLAGNARKLGAAALRVFEAADRKDGSALVIVPVMVLHEISSLEIGGRINLPLEFHHLVRALERHGAFQIVDIKCRNGGPLP